MSRVITILSALNLPRALVVTLARTSVVWRKAIYDNNVQVISDKSEASRCDVGEENEFRNGKVTSSL